MLSCFSSCKKNMPIDGVGTSQRSAGDKDLDLLGHGYNALGNFADEQEGRGLVINVKKIRSEQANRIEVGTLSYQNFDVNSAEDSRKYINNILTKINIDARYLLFSTTLRSSFTDYDSTETSYSYASVDKLVVRKKLSIIMGIDEIKSKYLSANFLSDCETMSPQDIIKYYGTHVLRDITLGGKLSAKYRSRISSTDKKHKVEIGVKAGVFKVFGLGMSVGGGTNINESELTENKYQTLTYSAIGGDPSINIAGTVNLAPGVTTPTIDLTAWQSSVDLDNSHLIDIGQDGLIPIYELVPGYKGTLVKDYFMSHYSNFARGIDYFQNGDLFYWEYSNDKVFTLMKMPDEIKVIGEAKHQGISLKYIPSSFPNISIIERSDLPQFYRWINSIIHEQFLPHGSQYNSLRVKAYNNIIAQINSQDLARMNQYSQAQFPYRVWFTDLVNLKNTNKYYVRIAEFNQVSKSSKTLISESLYPISNDDILKFGFSKSKLIVVNSILESNIKKAF